MTENRKLRVFLCHSKNDKPKVRKLYNRLIADGFDVWLDEVKLMPGQDWELEIQKAVRSSDTVIVCLSKTASTKEGYIQKEIRFALDIADEKPEGTIFLIPTRLEECDVPNRIRRYQWIDLFKRFGYSKLQESLYLRMNNLNIRFDFKEISPKTNQDFVKVPSLGIISASANFPVSNDIEHKNHTTENSVEIAKTLLPKISIKSLFALKVQGDSMVDAMINDGDIVIMKPVSFAKNGEMVAAWLSDRNETTLKYFYKDKDGYRLQPANPAYKPIMIKKAEQMEIKGKVVMVIRKKDRYK